MSALSKSVLTSLKKDWPFVVAIVIILYVFKLIDSPAEPSLKPAVDETSGEVLNEPAPIDKLPPSNPRVDPADKTEFFFFDSEDPKNSQQLKLESF